MLLEWDTGLGIAETGIPQGLSPDAFKTAVPSYEHNVQEAARLRNQQCRAQTWGPYPTPNSTAHLLLTHPPRTCPSHTLPLTHSLHACPGGHMAMSLTELASLWGPQETIDRETQDRLNRLNQDKHAFLYFCVGDHLPSADRSVLRLPIPIPTGKA